MGARGPRGSGRGLGLRKVTWSNQGPAARGRPANGRRDRGQARQELLGPLESFHSEHPGGRGQQRTRGVQGPRQAPRPCHLSGCAPSRLRPAWLLPTPDLLLLRLSPQSPPNRSASPPHAPPAVSLLPTPFLLTLLPDAQRQAWGWEERLGWQGHSCGCWEGAWDGGVGTARCSRLGGPRPRLLLLWPA